MELSRNVQMAFMQVCGVHNRVSSNLCNRHILPPVILTALKAQRPPRSHGLQLHSIYFHAGVYDEICISCDSISIVQQSLALFALV